MVDRPLSWEALRGGERAWMPLPRERPSVSKSPQIVDPPDAAPRQFPPPRRPPAVRLPGKRRQRRRDMWDVLAAQAAKLRDDDVRVKKGRRTAARDGDDDERRDVKDPDEEYDSDSDSAAEGVDPRARDVTRRLIDDPVALRQFLNGATLERHVPRHETKNAFKKKGPPRAREAARAWLRVERRLRPALRRAARVQDPSLRGLETRVFEWLDAATTRDDDDDDDDGDDDVDSSRSAGGENAAFPAAVVVPEPTVPAVSSAALVLRVPTVVVDARLARALAQFHGCRVALEPPCVVLHRPAREHRLTHQASVFDVLL